MPLFKKKSPGPSIPFDPEKQEPAVRKSICTGEMTVGFVDKASGRFHELYLARSQAELEEGADRYAVEGLMPGTAYTLLVSTKCHCTGDTVTLSEPALLSFVTLPDTVGIHSPQTESPSVALYPNPATDCVTVECGEAVRTLSLVNVQGQVVRTWEAVEDVRPTVSLRGLPAGVYLLTVQTASGSVSQRLTIVR